MKRACGLAVCQVAATVLIAATAWGRPSTAHGTGLRSATETTRSRRGARTAQLFVGNVSPSPAADPAPPGSPLPPLETYWQALDEIQGGFYNPDVPQEPDRTNLTYAAIRGVLSSLNDPYTRFLSPGQYADMQNENRGTFPGIGVNMGLHDGKLTIDEIIPGSPAEAVLHLQDQVIKIDGRPVQGKTIEQAGAMLRGEEGTTVTLAIVRAGHPLNVTLKRKEITYPHFESRILEGNIGYMHLLMFDEQAADNVGKALDRFSRQGVKGIIFDLRDNPGGLLDAAVDVASKFIPAGPVVFVQERGGQRSSLNTNGDPPRKLPLVVLVNHYSASASEIVSGAIKDTHAGTLVGVTTWGKGLVQAIIPLNDNSAVALTIAHYFTPSGADINLRGVEPDIAVGHALNEPEDPADEAAFNEEKAKVDSDQLQRAIALIKLKIASSPVARLP